MSNAYEQEITCSNCGEINAQHNDCTPPPEASTLRKELVKLLSEWHRGLGIESHQIDNMASKLDKLIQERERLARINEMKRIMKGQKTVTQFAEDVDDIVTYVFSADEINERLKDLSKQAVKVKAVTK